MASGWASKTLTLTRGLAVEHGGGARVYPGETAYFRRVQFLANQAANGGGGFAIYGSSVDVTVAGFDECWFSENVALGATGGGAIFVLGSLTEIVADRTTLSDNHAAAPTGTGGALRITDATVTLLRSTLSGNRANSGGGAILLLSSLASSELVLHDSTVTANQADADGDTIGDGGGIQATISVGVTATIELANTIVAGNLDSGVQVHPDVSSFSPFTLVSLGFNLIGSDAGATSTLVAGLPNADGDWIGTAAAPIDPQLEALAAHGGFGPTHRPAAVAGTPVIDKGFCTGSGSDQRGYGDAALHVRIVDTIAPNAAGSDGCDIGAHERGGDPDADPDLFADDFEARHLLYWTLELP